MKYKLTVVTTTYNQENFIEDCIKGVLNQKTNFDFQFIISDDGSTDNTRDIITKYQKKYPDIIKPIFREKNLGPMKNFVTTLNEAHTEYVALCDGDDFWTDKNKLQMQVDFLDKNKKYTICFHKTKIIYDDNSQEPEIYPLEMKENLTFDDFMEGNFITANTVVYRWQFKKKNSLIEIFPDDIVPGDYFVHLYHAKKGDIHYIDKQMSCYRRQASGMWYGTSKPELLLKHYKKNGIKMIKFYDEAEKIFDINNDKFTNIKKWIIRESLNSAFRLNDKEMLNIIIKKYFIKYNDVFYDYCNSLKPIRKYIYILKTRKLRQQLKRENGEI